MRRFALLLIASASCLTAQAGWAKRSVYMSLMGELFRTNADGEDPLDQWFKLADQDGDGTISRLEFRSDAQFFFASLDTNGDKVIDGDEMAEYEKMAPGRTRAAGGASTSSSRPQATSSAPVEQGQVAVVSSGNVPSATRIHPGGGPIDFSDMPQPVAMADLNLDRRVTLDEFMKTADKRFTTYDANGDGRLTRKELP
jgi:Ca2+-binding EF-hand superfamily protein